MKWVLSGDERQERQDNKNETGRRATRAEPTKMKQGDERQERQDNKNKTGRRATSQEHPNNSGIFHVDVRYIYATEICNLGYQLMQLRFKDVPIRAKPQCLNASVELGAGGMRAQPVKINFIHLYKICSKPGQKKYKSNREQK